MCLKKKLIPKIVKNIRSIHLKKNLTKNYNEVFKYGENGGRERIPQPPSFNTLKHSGYCIFSAPFKLK